MSTESHADYWQCFWRGHRLFHHTPGIEVAIAAVALGAAVIEKHFTMDRNLPGPDHKASLEPDELKAMVQAIRNIEKALGNGIKRPSPSEVKNKTIARKSLVATQPINTGERFSAYNVTAKRPGTGISPMRWDEVLEQLRKNYDVVGEGYLKPPACWRMYSWAAPPVSFLVSFLNFIERSCAR